MVVGVRGAVGAVVTVDRIARIASIVVTFEFALSELDVRFGDEGVLGELAAGKDFAGVAVAEDVTGLIDLGGPFGLTAMAATLEFRHDDDKVSLLDSVSSVLDRSMMVLEMGNGAVEGESSRSHLSFLVCECNLNFSLSNDDSHPRSNVLYLFQLCWSYISLQQDNQGARLLMAD